MIILDGKSLSLERREALKGQTAQFQEKWGLPPCLAVVLVGDDPASQVYVRNKIKACEQAGIKSIEKRLPATATQEQVLSAVQTLNSDDSVHGILVQLPLPKHIDADLMTQAVSPMKDADGLTYFNQGLLFAGKKRIASCTPWGVIQLLKKYNIPMAGANVVVVGRSQIVGKPMAQLLLDENATVTICHSKTKNMSEFLQKADIVVVAAGKPLLLGKSDFKKDAVIVDVGIHRGADGKLCGDVRFNELEGWAKAATPVPGGVGPMTIAMLLENTLHLAKLQQEMRGQNG